MDLSFTFGSSTLTILGAGKDASVLGIEYIPGVAASDMPKIVDSMIIKLSGTGADLHAFKENLIFYLEAGTRRAAHVTGSIPYINATPDGVVGSARSRIYSGSAIWIGTAPLKHIGAGFAQLMVSFERDNFWEGAITALQMTNMHGTDQTTLQVDNITDRTTELTHQHSVLITGTDINSEISTPAIISLVNTYVSVDRNSQVYIAQNVESDPMDLFQILEAETSEIGNLSFSSVADAARSGGFYGSWSWSGNTSSAGSLMARYTLDSAWLTQFRGNNVRVLMGTVTQPTNSYVKIKILFEVTTIYESGWIPIDTAYELQEMASFQLPPFLYEDPTLAPYPLYFDIYVRDDDGTSKSFGIDFFAIQPIDGWRILFPIGYGQGQNVELIDDPVANQIYTTGWTTPGIVGNYVSFGKPIMLIPGRDQAISFLWESSAGHQPYRTMNVEISYRPRRRLL